MEGQVATADPARVCSLILVLLLAVVLPVLPVLAAHRPAFDVGATAAAAAGLAAAVLGGVKFAAVAWGLVSRGSEPRLGRAASVVE